MIRCLEQLLHQRSGIQLIVEHNVIRNVAIVRYEYTFNEHWVAFRHPVQHFERMNETLCLVLLILLYARNIPRRVGQSFIKKSRNAF